MGYQIDGKISFSCSIMFYLYCKILQASGMFRSPGRWDLASKFSQHIPNVVHRFEVTQDHSFAALHHRKRAHGWEISKKHMKLLQWENHL